MKSICLVMVIVVLVLCIPIAHSSASDGAWAPLFNGKNLDGWRQLNGWAMYMVDGDTIVGTTAAGSPNSFLCTEKHYGNFELQFQVTVAPRLNSGVQVRSNSFPEYRTGRVHGYQVEIASNGSAGFIYDEARRGWLSTDRSDPAARAGYSSRWS